jgi:8-amino-7-oxononanoate synthase
MYKRYEQCCNDLQDTEKYRKLPDIILNLPRNLIDFSNNDYLAFSKRIDLFEAAKLAGSQYGVGSTGSRLLSGNSAIFTDLEMKIAKDKKTQEALVFNSGFQTNITVLAALLDSVVLGAKPIVFCDRLNHSSIYQGIFLSKAELVRYNHNDMDHLSDLLCKFQHNNRPKFIVTETVFGMDGDIISIRNIADLAIKYGAFLYLDEAHGTGIVGKRLYGLSTNIDLQAEGIEYLVMGTFSKALGCFGAFVACSLIIKNYLINKCSGFIYSTSISPMLIGAISKAWDLIQYFENERDILFTRADKLRTKLHEYGFDTGASSTHIVPVIMGTEKSVIKAQTAFSISNILVSAIRPPSVPPNRSRIRIALNINHNDHDIDRLISVFASLK